jgi:Ser/Thr protein kinase RdoA (MazF antagonist)
MQYDVPEIASQFDLPGVFCAAEPYGSGHINDTYVVTHDSRGLPVRFIVQRINSDVFRTPIALMENIGRVTGHLRQRMSAFGDHASDRRILTLVPTHDGSDYHQDAAGNVWRAFIFIEGAHTHDTIKSAAQAYQAARAFGRFQDLLSDLPEPRLHETIPDFHHSRRRFDAFAEAVRSDPFERAAQAEREIEFAFRHEPVVDVLLGLHEAGEIPERVTHNDAKLNNVLMDDESGEAVCVIDLDTVMPGLTLFDFGDMVRSATTPAEEDERDLDNVVMRMPMFEALASGYLASVGSILNQTEKELLPFAGRLITFECGIRFLTDFLVGDSYFKVHRDGHNLDRARTQFKLVDSIVEQEAAMKRFVAGVRS